MQSNDMIVKSEFVTPWGICDLVGLAFNPDRAARRLSLKQTRTVSSITRAVLLLKIPDVEDGKSITVDRLARHCAPSIPEDVVLKEVERLVADRFVIALSRGRLQKVNRWMPLHDRLVAVELKLLRVEQAMRQALNNLRFADESYAALPVEVACRVASSACRWSRFFDAGVGLLGVSRRSCEILVPARKTSDWTDKAVQLYCVEKFWRSSIRGNSASEVLRQPPVSAPVLH
jgi:hypothetical protein